VAQSTSEFFSEQGFVPARLGQRLADEGRVQLGHDGRPYRYLEGVYRPDAASWAAGQVRDLLGERYRRRHLDEVMSWLKATQPTIPLEQPIEFLNLNSGLLDWSSGNVRPHDPAALSTIRIPHRWNPEAKSPATDAFLIEVLPGDAIDFLLEVIGHCLIPDNRLQRSVMLVGPGGNGKGTLLNLIRALLGPANVSARSLHALAENKFAAADLVGKLANVCGDLDARAIERSDVFKMVTGGDVMSGEHKFGHAFTFVPFCRLLFSANEVPPSADQTRAYFDRWLPVPMTCRFRGTEQEDPDLLRKLTAEAELEGLLVQAVEALRRLMKRGHFDIPASVKGEAARFQEHVDTVIAFLGDSCEVDLTAWTSRRELYTAYTRWCGANGRRPLASRNVYSKLLEQLPSLTERPRQGVRGFTGLRVAAGA